MKIPFQFSIRELLLVTLAAAALLALARTHWKQSQQIQGTDLSNQFFIPAEVEKFANEEGLKGRISYLGGGGAAGGSDFTRRGRSGKYSFELPVEYHDAIVGKLRQSIEDKITAGGCRINGRGSGSSGYNWNYSRDSLDGIAELMTISERGEKNRLHVMFLVIERSKAKQ